MVLEKCHDKRLIHGKLHRVEPVDLVVLHLLHGKFVIKRYSGSLDNLLDSLLCVPQDPFV